MRAGQGRLETEDETRIRRVLTTQLVSLNFHDEPLDPQYVGWDARRGIANVVLDRPSIEDEGLNTDTPVSLQVEKITLAKALSNCSIRSSWRRSSVLMCSVIVNANEASQELKIRVYPALIFKLNPYLLTL